MTTPPPPVPGSDGPDEPVLDSFAAESPAEPADAATGVSTPPVDLPGPAQPAAEEPPVLNSFAAESPAEPADAATGVSTPPDLAPPAPAEPVGEPPQGSQGLTTAPPPLTAPEPEAPAPVEPPVDIAPEAPPAPEQRAEPAEPVAPAEPAVQTVLPPEPPADPVVAGHPLPTEAPPTDAPPAAAPSAAGAARGRTWVPLAAVGLAVALLAGATGWLGWQLRQQDRAEQAGVDAIAAARDAARLLFSYDHTTLQADFDKGLAVTTGEFRTQYQRTTKDVVSPVATQYKAVVLAEVVEAAVIDARADEVTALVFLNQATTSTRVQGQQVDQSRVRMRLVPRDGRWLVEEVKAL